MTTFATKILSAGFLFLSCFLLVSCGDDDMITTPGVTVLPAAAVTTYDGELVYTSATGEVIIADDGEAEIKSSGSGYKIEFSDGVPTLDGLQFENESGEYVTVGSNSDVVVVSIDGDDLDLTAVLGGATWAFSGTK